MEIVLRQFTDWKMKNPLFKVHIVGKTGMSERTQRKIERILAFEFEQPLSDAVKREQGEIIFKQAWVKNALKRAANKTKINQQFDGEPPFQKPHNQYAWGMSRIVKASK